MNVMTPTIERPPVAVADIASDTADNCIALRVRRMSRIVTRVYDDALRGLGITASQYTLLAQLANRDGTTAVEIGYTLDIEKSTLSRNLKRLLALGMIDMDPPAGRRGRGLHLTATGQSTLQTAYPVWKTAQQRVKTIMGENTREILDGLMVDAEKLGV